MENLYDHQRDQISRIFGCLVANGYGGRDAGFIAHECPSGGMHITAEDITMEIADDAGNPVPHGRAGEGVKQRLGQAVQVEIERVEAIPKETSGKYRYVVSRVNPAPVPAPEILGAYLEHNHADQRYLCHFCRIR